MAEIRRLFMNKVLVFAVLVFATGLLFSCSSDTKPEEDIPGQEDSSSSGGLPLSSSPNGGASSSSSLPFGETSSSSSSVSEMVFCELSDGTCLSTPISQEECYIFDGTPVQSCAGSSSSNGEASSSSFSDDPLTCGTLPSFGYVTSPITSPALTCKNRETASSIRWLGSPVIDWDNPKGGTYSDIKVMANCGTETDLMASCPGTLTVRYVLSCSMPSIGYEGEAIKPVLSCSDGSTPSDIVFSGYPPNWENPVLGSYAVLVEASCGQGVLPKISCGTLKVNPVSCSGGGDNTSTHYCSEGTMKRYVILTDTRGNKTYKTVVIGTQTWMAENLNTGYICGAKDCDTYGNLYDWSTAMSLPSSCNSSTCSNQIQSKHQGVCPAGWHLPSREEWEVMTTYIGGVDTEGKKLKATSGWIENGNGTDDYGFSALPGGYCSSVEYCISSFSGVGTYGGWWIAGESNRNYASSRYMNYTYDGAGWNGDFKSYLRSVRCLQD